MLQFIAFIFSLQFSEYRQFNCNAHAVSYIKDLKQIKILYIRKELFEIKFLPLVCLILERRYLIELWFNVFR